MLAPIIDILKSIFIPLLFLSGIIILIVTIFKRIEWGLFFMVFLVPQPNIFFKFHQFPFGKEYITLLFLAILLGILFQKKAELRTGNLSLIIVFILFNYLSLWNSTTNFSLPAPVTRENFLLQAWKNYTMMILMYFIAFNVIKNEDQQKKLVVIMSVVILFMSIRSFRGFSGGLSYVEASRYGGPFEAAGLGPNHFGAFIVHYCSLLLGLFLFDNDKKRKLLYLITMLFGLHPLFFTYSRGAYLAALCVLAFLGIVKKRSLLVLVLILFVSWQTLLPASVADRVKMTKSETGDIDHAAQQRLELWSLAEDIFRQNPIFGVGFGGFGLTVSQQGGEFTAPNTDSHNYFLKMLCEQGVVGLTLFIFIFFRAFLSGWKLFKGGTTPFNRGLGFGFLGCVVAVIVTNMFGDRWSNFVMGSYFWIFWGLVDRGILISKTLNSSDIQIE